MALVPIRDDYTDAATPQVSYTCHTPVMLGNDHTLMITNKGQTSGGGGGGNTFASFSAVTTPGPQARMYDTSSQDWTRGDPFGLDTIDPANARACAATLDGNVLLQGQVPVATTTTAPAQFAEGLVMGSPWTIYSLGYSGGAFTQLFRVSEAADICYATFGFDDADGWGDDADTSTITCSIAMLPDGSGTLGESAPQTVSHTRRDNTFALGRITVIPGVDYYITLKTTSANLGRLMLTSDNVHFGPLDTDFTCVSYLDGVGTARVAACTLGYVVEEEHPVETWQTGTGYAVLDVSGEQLVALGPTYALAGAFVDDIGYCYSHPDSMARIPTTNRFWAWRHHVDPSNVHRLYVDLLQVTGTNAAVLGTVAVTGDLTGAHTPHQIIPVNSGTAISLMSLPDRLRLVHLVVDTANNVTLSTQDILGYPPNDGVTLVPGLNHQAELLVKAAADDPLKLIRLGITWEGSSFIITSLPITQLTAGIKPPDYTPRTKTASVSIVAGSAQAAAGGVVVTARPYVSNATDDNWILITEYNQATGEIIANTWKKGDINGGKYDTLQLLDLGLRYDSASERIIIGATEYYKAAAASASFASRTPRLGVYRHGYVLSAAKRSQREQFER